MHQQIFVNLPVADVQRSRAFFEALGYAIDPRYSNAQAVGIVLGENLHAMLLDRAFFAGFTKKPIADAHQVTEAINCLSCSSREQVDDLVAKAVAAGGTAPNPVQDHGFMYGHGFQDPDGHVWELVYMSGTPPGQG